MDFSNLRKELEVYMGAKDIKFVETAFHLAEGLHHDALRLSGEPFITHPLSVAIILARLHLDRATIVAALLHDVVEDTSCSLKDIQKEFGQEVSSLVDGVTKMMEIKHASIEEGDAEQVRKLLMASTKDLRVILIKLADKVHNMRTLESLPRERQLRIAKEALNIYAPLAYRLGIASMKWELEDLAFKYLEPEMYQMFKERFGKKRADRERDIQEINSVLEKALKEHKISARIVGRPKHFYSIYKKMITKNRKFEEVHDLIGLRVITKSLKDCYDLLGMIHNIWQPIPGEFKDYIAMPKANGYQSLHTAVVALKQPVEFQIRTEEMDILCEEGIAAHWKYKHMAGDAAFDKKLSWLRELLEWKGNTKEFMEFVKVDLFDDEIYVLTPKGDVVSLPKGSCPLDFAFKIHSTIGGHCQGALVNGRMVPLRHELKNGDMVQILTSKAITPKRDWLKVVKTTRAKSKIKQSLRSHGDIPIHTTQQSGVLRKGSAQLIHVDHVSNPKIRMAHCCHPVPDDPIVAYASSKLGYTIHRTSCEAMKEKSGKMVKASWNESSHEQVMVKVITEDRVGVFADILGAVAAANVNVDPARAKALHNGLVECNLGFIPENLDHMKDIVNRIKKVRGVRTVVLQYPAA